METQKIDCASCGSPIQIPDNAEMVICPYCGTQLGVKRDGNYATLKVMEQISQVVQQTGDGTRSAIREGAQATQSELKRLQINQDIGLMQLQLSNIQSEIRSLEREKKDRVVKRQINELRIQENDLQQRIQALQSAILSPEPEEQKAVGQPEAYVHTQPQQEKGGKRARTPLSGLALLIIGGSVFLLGSCIFLLFILGQFGSASGATDNLVGFIGAQIICSLPIILLGLALSIFGYLRLRKEKKNKAPVNPAG